MRPSSFRAAGPIAPRPSWSTRWFAQGSNSLRQPDREARAGLDRPGDHPVAECLRRLMGERGVAMRELVGARRLYRLGEFRIAPGKAFGLVSVMPVDDLLDRDGAGHRGALAEQRGRRAERVARDVPERRQRRRPHPALGGEAVELREVAQLLLLHLADRTGNMAAADHRELPGIDARRAVFPGLVDADHPRRVIRHAVAGQIRWAPWGFAFAHAATRERLRPRTAAPQNTAIASEARKFQPASETPKRDHWTWSHMTGCLPSSCARNSSMLMPARRLAGEARGAGDQCCPSPAGRA